MKFAPKQLLADRRCRGRKVMTYKRPPHLFCPRCNAAYDPIMGHQIDNWAYRGDGEGFVPVGISSMGIAELVDQGRATILSGR